MTYVTLPIHSLYYESTYSKDFIEFMQIYEKCENNIPVYLREDVEIDDDELIKSLSEAANELADNSNDEKANNNSANSSKQNAQSTNDSTAKKAAGVALDVAGAIAMPRSYEKIKKGEKPTAWDVVKDASELGLTAALSAILPGAGGVLFKSAVGAMRTAKIANAAKKAGDALAAAKASKAAAKAQQLINKLPPDTVELIRKSTANTITKLAKQHNIPVDKIEQIAKNNPEKLTQLQASMQKAIEKEASVINKSPKVVQAAANAEKAVFKQTAKDAAKTLGNTAKDTIKRRAKDAVTNAATDAVNNLTNQNEENNENS